MEVARKKDGNISTHVLDQAKGLPAGNLRVELHYNTDPAEYTGEGECTWERVGEFHTDSDGRAKFAFDINPGIYKMVFFTHAYFQQNAIPNFYPKVEIMFRLTDVYRHHHVPLLLSPYGYSTYRGS